MSKGEGRNIIIKFTDDLVGDVSDNINAFTVTGKEYQWVDGPDNNGPLLDKEYVIDKVERYGTPPLWNSVFMQGNHENTNVVGGALTLKLPETKLIAVEDSFARQTSPTSVNGDLDYLNVLGTNGYHTRSYLRFETPERDIVKAELFLYYFANDIPSREQRHYIKRLTQSFDEETLSYNNAPSFYGEGSLSSGAYGRLENVDGHNTGINKWRSADITGLVQEWVQSVYPNYGLVLDHNYGSSYDGGIWASIKYRSKEYEDPNYHPYIEVQYAPFIGSIIGNWISPVIQSSGQYRVRWQEDKPAGTDITIEYTTGQIQGTWIEILNGDVITSDTNLWLRVTLETTDTSVTPTLQDLWIEEPDAPQDKIRIVMDEFSRFPSVVGDITVEYDATIGNLAGRGGPVESFTEEFTPTGLVQKPNPGPAENFKMTAAAAVDFIKIEYNNRYTAENFKITAAATITLTFVGVVNP